MLKELTQAVTTAVKNGETRMLDLYHKDACVGVWTPMKNFQLDLVKEQILSYQDFLYQDTQKQKQGGLILSKENMLRKVAEKNKCKSVRIFWEATELEFYKKHEMFKTVKDIIDFLNTLPEETLFYLKSYGKCYPAESCLLFNVQKVWLKFRADFSMYELPPASINGELTIKPEGDQYHVFWEDAEGRYVPYRHHLRLKDIEILEESDVVAELL